MLKRFRNFNRFYPLVVCIAGIAIAGIGQHLTSEVALHPTLYTAITSANTLFVAGCVIYFLSYRNKFGYAVATLYASLEGGEAAVLLYLSLRGLIFPVNALLLGAKLYILFGSLKVLVSIPATWMSVRFYINFNSHEKLMQRMTDLELLTDYHAALADYKKLWGSSDPAVQIGAKNALSWIRWSHYEMDRRAPELREVLKSVLASDETVRDSEVRAKNHISSI